MRPQIADLLPLTQIPPGARVLDLGCGPGTVPYARFPRLRFYGIDQFAHPDTRGWPKNACLALADAERLPWADGCFDAALCNFVFEHLREPRVALRELDRVVRPGGLLYMSVPRHSSMEDRLYRLTVKGGGHLQRYTLQGFLELMYQESGFKLEAMAPSPAAFTWLQTVPVGNFLRWLLYRAFRLWARATGHDPLASGSYLLLFKMDRRRGFLAIARVCSACGCSIHGDARASPAPSPAFWRCPVCGFENLAVS
jgi:SAM-dependent methyltransferase